MLSENGVSCVIPRALSPCLWGSQNFSPPQVLYPSEESCCPYNLQRATRPITLPPGWPQYVWGNGVTDVQMGNPQQLNWCQTTDRVHLNNWRPGGFKKTARCMWGSLSWLKENSQARAGFSFYLKGGSSPFLIRGTEDSLNIHFMATNHLQK